jgi:hypothetical protein
MAAATTDTSASANKDGSGALERHYRSSLAHQAFGIPIPVLDKVTVPATAIDDANDILRLSPKFGPDTVLHDFAGTPSDLDSGANHVYDIIWVTEAGATTLTLVSGSTKGQAASGSDEAAAAAKYRHVGEGYLAMKTTTGAAGGATAGTYSYGMTLSRGVMKPGQTGVYLRDARA